MPPLCDAVNQPRKPRVLIADDSAGMRVYLRAILTSAGYESVEVADGGAAFDALMGGSRFDLVVTDLHMPEMDGFALLSAVSLMPVSRGRPPVVVCSAFLGEGAMQRRDELRLAAVVLAKPVQPEDLLKAAEKAIRVGPARD